MKKRLISLILFTAILLSMIVVPTYAEAPELVQENVTSPTETCPCGCGEKIEDIVWKPWAARPGSGHYYLTGDYVMEEFNVISGESTVLDLRGYTITTAGNSRLFTVNGYLAILDTAGGGRATAKGQYHEVGGVVKVTDNETSGSKFELFSGTIALADGHTTPGAGGLIHVSSGGSFIMHSGLLLEGTAYGSGGCLAVSDATAEVLGGKIIGGTANVSGGNIFVESGATLTMKDTTLIGGTAKDKGGNLYVSASAANIDNCSIGNGVANHTTTGTQYGGGNICTYASSTLNLTDSEIYGGYALLHGGNICFGTGTYNLKNNQVWGGSCGGQGANVYAPFAKTALTIDGGTYAGDVYSGDAALTLKGALKIGMNANGLVLKNTSKTVKVSGLTSGAEIYVSGNTGKISGSLTYLKPALNATLSASGTTITVAAADGAEAGYCPHCSAKATWQSYGTADATHMYLTADMADFAEVDVTSDLCIDLRGFDITATGRAFSVAAGGKLTIIDSVGGGIVTGAGVEGENGGVINNAGELTIRGGKYTYAAGNTVTGGGIIYTTSDITLSGAVLDAGAFTNTAADVFGGAVCVANASGNISLTGCRVLGGSAYRGGGIYMGYNNKATIEGCQISGSKAVTGGANLSTNGNGTHLKGVLTLSKTLLSGGEGTTEYAGNFHLTRWSATVTDCYLRDGKTKDSGGNLSIGITSSAGATFTNTVISGGSSRGNGGNILDVGSSKNVVFTNCLITDGSAATGGNIEIDNGVFTFSGCEISYGSATGNGGNLYAKSTAGITLTDGVLLCGGRAGSNGGNLYVSKTVNLADVTFHNGSAGTSGDDIYLSDEESTQLNIGSGLVGDVYLGASSSLLSKSESGMEVGNLHMLEGATFNANIYLGGDYGNAALQYVNGKFYTASVQLTKANGEKLWFENNAAAVAAAAPGDHLKLYSSDDLVLDKDLYVDINGYCVTVSGSGKLYGLDSAGDDFSVSTGTLTATGSVTVAADATAKSGNRYLALGENNTYTFHRIELKITGVSIRPNSAGMYYTAKWACDEVLQAEISVYGVVASTAKMPGSDFASREENLYTVFAADSFVSGEAKNGAVITGIMSEDHTENENVEAGKTPVYAKAYITFENGNTLVSSDNIGYSLYDVMKNLDRLIINKPDQYRKYNQTARDFYESWKDNGMGGWDLIKIPDPGEDGIIDVLMVGSSFCYYYVQELYALGQAAGIDIRVCNLYYGSCTLEKHYNWWVNGESNYQYYETFHDGRIRTSNVSLEWALSQHEWDFISLQEHTPTIYDNDNHFEDAKGRWEPLMSYFIQQFPNAQVMWHQTWTYQSEYGKTDQPQTPEQQQTNQAEVEAFVKQICDYYNVPAGETLVQRVNTGRAWQIMRTEFNYDYMCCRLGKTNHDGTADAGDGFHDGDIGGGQYLNACVWFEVITGKSVVGNTFSPEFTTSTVIDDALFDKLNLVKTETGYALTPEFVTLIQQVAHKAVGELGLEVE